MHAEGKATTISGDNPSAFSWSLPCRCMMTKLNYCKAWSQQYLIPSVSPSSGTTPRTCGPYAVWIGSPQIINWNWIYLVMTLRSKVTALWQSYATSDHMLLNTFYNWLRALIPKSLLARSVQEILTSLHRKGQYTAVYEHSKQVLRCSLTQSLQTNGTSFPVRSMEPPCRRGLDEPAIITDKPQTSVWCSLNTSQVFTSSIFWG